MNNIIKLLIAKARNSFSKEINLYERSWLVNDVQLFEEPFELFVVCFSKVLKQ